MTVSATVVSTTSTRDLGLDAAAMAVVGDRWLHTVEIENEFGVFEEYVNVVVRSSGLGWAMEIPEASDVDVATAAMAAVAEAPRGKEIS